MLVIFLGSRSYELKDETKLIELFLFDLENRQLVQRANGKFPSIPAERFLSLDLAAVKPGQLIDLNITQSGFSSEISGWTPVGEYEIKIKN